IKDIIHFDTVTTDIISDTEPDTTITPESIADIGDEDFKNIVDTFDEVGVDASSDVQYEDILDTSNPDNQVLQPIINELMVSPNFSDTELGQYIEIYNPNDFGIDINGYKIKTDAKEFTISNSDCDTVIMAKSYLVIGATKDPLKNSYAKVRCEWTDKFTLTDATYVELLRTDDVLVEKINLSSLAIKKGNSMERDGNIFKPAPSLITFLDETGLYNGDRGSPAKPNYNLIIRDKLLDSEPQRDRIEYENSVHRYSAELAEGYIVAFYADVDRINGDLKLFASLLDSKGEFITPDIYNSDITYDFFIYQLIKETGTYFFQIQPDFFYKFVPADIEATYFRADGIKIKKDFIQLKVGEQYQIEGFATFSQNKDLKDFPIEKTLLSYSSNDPNIAE
ncbi:MAG: lamin tail domain-containing protein, partial [Myxococcota bacterium]